MKVVTQETAGGAITLYDFEPPAARLLDDVLRGLTAPVKSLPPKWFYDEAGALLFERICELDAYYPTRTEIEILRRHLPEITAELGPECRVVEFGSGSGIKTQMLLEHLDRPAAYLPVDISRAQLVEFAFSVAERFPALEVLPVCADYTGAWTIPPGSRAAARTVVFFPGSTIGNFETGQARAFLRRAAALAGADGAMLIGVDLKKDAATVERAYNDPEGVTAAFNLNLLARINRECGADFDLSAFRHHAPYDAAEGRIEMRLVSRRAQTVRIDGADDGAVDIPFAEGEHIVTEYSHKYTPDEVRALAAAAGWSAERLWTDERGWFGVFLLRSGRGSGQDSGS